jgi:hypothetical protein
VIGGSEFYYSPAPQWYDTEGYLSPLTFPRKLHHGLGSPTVLSRASSARPMTRKRHTDEQIIAVLKDAEAMVVKCLLSKGSRWAEIGVGIDKYLADHPRT